MKVSKLIEQLQNMDQDLPVYFSYEYGDYWGSVVADDVSHVDEIELVYSAYHQRMSVPGDNEDIDEYSEKPHIQAVVIS
jgi:hypothetical protein